MSKDLSRIVKTSDGSDTLYSKKFDAHYHSIHGAIEESIHVFISAGLEYALKLSSPPISILEIGFGTGLNALLSLISAKEGGYKVQYTGIEKYPISFDEYAELNYLDLLNRKEFENAFEKMHISPWDKQISLSPEVKFEKRLSEFENFDSFEKFDVVYFDAFSPSVQPHLWESSFLRKIYGFQNPGGILVSYCAKGSFKRALKDVGFTIQVLNGPSGKREMTRAIRPK